MIQRPQLKKYLTIFPISETTWGLRGGSEEFWRIKLGDERSQRALGGLLPYLNGQYEVEEILARIGEQGVEREVASRLLQHLEDASFLEDSSAADLKTIEISKHQAQIAFFSRFTSEGGAKFQALLRRSSVGLVGGGGPLGRCIIRQLTNSGIGQIVTLVERSHEPETQGTAESGAFPGLAPEVRTLELDYESIWPASAGDDRPDLFILAEEAHDPQLLEAMDAFSKQLSLPWMLLRISDPHEGWVGPLFIPGETASFASLEGRLRGQMRFFDDYLAFDRHLRNGSRSSAPCGGLEPFFEHLAAVAVVEVIKFLTGFSVPLLAGRFLTVNLMTWETEVHDVLRIPHLENRSIDRPRVFPWKDIPYDERKTRRG